MPDFTRFARSQRGQRTGQILGLPTTMTFFSVLSILITSGTIAVYGSAIWDPIQLSAKFSNPAVVILGLVTVLVATVSVNVAANVVSPSYDFSNAAPRWVSFRTGGIITGVVAVLMQPWRLLSNPHVYIFVWLGFYGGLLGALLAVGGAYSAPGQGPFPADGLIPMLKPLYDYSWAVGFLAGFVVYLVLSLPVRSKAPAPLTPAV